MNEFLYGHFNYDRPLKFLESEFQWTNSYMATSTPNTSPFQVFPQVSVNEFLYGHFNINNNIEEQYVSVSVNEFLYGHFNPGYGGYFPTLWQVSVNEFLYGHFNLQ